MSVIPLQFSIKPLGRIGRRREGFTMVELLTSIVIIGILIGVFYSVFISNWKAMENYSIRAALWQEMDRMIDQITLDAREAAQLTVSGDQKTVDMLNPQGLVFVSYALRNDGTCQTTRGAAVSTLGNFVNFDQSSFQKQGEALVVRLALTDNAFEYGVTIDASTEIYPRN